MVFELVHKWSASKWYLGHDGVGSYVHFRVEMGLEKFDVFDTLKCL